VTHVEARDDAHTAAEGWILSHFDALLQRVTGNDDARARYTCAMAGCGTASQPSQHRRARGFGQVLPGRPLTGNIIEFQCVQKFGKGGCLSG
jgi:hypothetical protein